jgi:mannose-6-phosphate isomerase
MQAAYFLDNPVMPYAWGSFTALADLLGQPRPSAEPQAELWLGAHPKAPSQAACEGGSRALNDLIAEAPDQMLGAAVATAHGGRLPFLLKVLAAREPLSIQAHPSLAQAREGFARENRKGIALDAPQRNYRDDNHKPELICALTPFWALCGFRPPDQIARLLLKACGDSLESLIAELQSSSSEASLKDFLKGLLSLSASRRNLVLEETVSFCLTTLEDAAHWRWIPRLAQAYPGDIGALAPLFLNLVCLQPGEALFLPAGELHAYLEGTGIEIMANSDNVLRGGLTPKHVDLPELLAVLNFAPYPLKVVTARDIAAGVAAFDAYCPEFQLHMLFPSQNGGAIELTTRGPEILLCTAGDLEIKTGASEAKLNVKKGAGVFIPAATPSYRISGEGCVYRASVPAAASGMPAAAH